MARRWVWLRVRRGFAITHDGRAFAAGDLMRVPAIDARAWAVSTSPTRPWLAVRMAYSMARAVRLVRQAMGETLAARRRASVRRRRAAEAVRKRAMVVKVVKR